jgi:hypothetical protein
MKRATAALAVAGMLTSVQAARAVESAKDVETDHIDAADDGGPRSAGLLLRPIAMATGWLGAEIDAACGEHAVLTLEGDGRFARTRGVRAALGVVLYPQRFAFHGIYVRGLLEWDRVSAANVATVLGAAITVGYAWTLPVGAALRLGAGAGYARGKAGDGQAPIALQGLGPRVDADLGWVF